MNLRDFLNINPEIKKLTDNIPESVKVNAIVKEFKEGDIIQRKDDNLTGVSIICSGKVRVINEFANGNACLIEENSAIDFIGEVTALANKENTSVTIEAISDCTMLFLSLRDFYEWIEVDNSFLLFLSRRLAQKLYASSYRKGMELFYPATYLVSKFFIDYMDKKNGMEENTIIDLTRGRIAESVGVSERTVNRVIRDLKEEKLISVKKGKVNISPIQYINLCDYIEDMLFE